MKLILASSSPRRAEVLRNAGIDFEVRPADIDEHADTWTNQLSGYVQRLALEKGSRSGRMRRNKRRGFQSHLRRGHGGRQSSRNSTEARVARRRAQNAPPVERRRTRSSHRPRRNPHAPKDRARNRRSHQRAYSPSSPTPKSTPTSLLASSSRQSRHTYGNPKPRRSLRNPRRRLLFQRNGYAPRPSQGLP